MNDKTKADVIKALNDYMSLADSFVLKYERMDGDEADVLFASWSAKVNELHSLIHRVEKEL